jgi:predicted ATPase
MGKNGENLPAALKNLERESPEAFAELLDNLRLAVPSVEKVETDYVETRELGLFLKEAGMSRRMYSSELSDGTLRTIGIFLPLADPAYRVVVIEEPENCTHPWVTRQFVRACRDHCLSKQIVLTTHSPVLVSQLRADELLVVERPNGETQIRKLTKEEAEDVTSARIADLGTYWDSGALGAVPVQLEFFGQEKA